MQIKSIAELKAEIEQLRLNGKPYMRKVLYLKGINDERQSLSQKIDSDVGKCEVIILRDYGKCPEEMDTYCKSVPEAQKCEGCKKALEIKRWLE